jgi:DNA-directed RNA polymerase II subunit RPB2
MRRGVEYAYFPHEARIRNLTYQIDSKVDVHIEKRKRNKRTAGELIEKYESKCIDLGKIPVMIRSSQCYLSDCNDKAILKNKECMYD